MDRNITLYDWLNTWLNNYAKYLVKISTFVNYEGYINNHFIEIGNILLNNISSYDLQEFFNKKLKTLSAKTVRNMLSVLKKSFKQAMINEILDKNVALDIFLPKMDKKEIKVLNKKQQQSLLKRSYEYRYGTFIRLALCTGIRLGELLALKWEDIDLENRKLYIRRTINRLKNYDINYKYKTKIYFDKPQTKNSNRIIPLPQSAIEDLIEWQKLQIEEKYKLDFVVTNESGHFIEQTTFKNHYNQILRDCNIHGVTFHALRHTFATIALEKGMDSKVLSEILGHYSVSFTLDTYAHVLDNFKIQNMQLMDDIYVRGQNDNTIILQFKKFKDKYIVSIPQNNQYTFIAKSVEEGINYIENKRKSIILNNLINVNNILLDNKNSKNNIIVII